MWNYQAKVLRWIDGDTVVLQVDLGFWTTTTQTFRLEGVDTPEKGKPGYQEACDFVRSTCPVGSMQEVTTYKPDKYGRWLVDIHLGDDNLTNWLISEGLGVGYWGGSK